MISVKEGKFFYRLTTEKTDKYKEDLLAFLVAKGVQDKELQKVIETDFKSIIGTAFTIKQSSFDLNVKIAENEVVLLFGGKMDSEEFNDLVEGFFQ